MFNLYLTSQLITDSIKTITDTLPKIATGKVVENIAPHDQWFENKIFIAIFAAIFTQLAVVIIAFAKKKLDLRSKRKLVLTDLREKKRLLHVELSELIGLKEKFLAGLTGEYTSLYQYELNTLVFDSVSKPELFEIFNDKVIALSNIYSALAHLRDNGSKYIFERYLKWQDDVAVKQDLLADVQATRLQLLRASIKSTELCISNVEEVLVSIEQVLKK